MLLKSGPLTYLELIADFKVGNDSKKVRVIVYIQTNANKLGTYWPSAKPAI